MRKLILQVSALVCFSLLCAGFNCKAAEYKLNEDFVRAAFSGESVKIECCNVPLKGGKDEFSVLVKKGEAPVLKLRGNRKEGAKASLALPREPLNCSLNVGESEKFLSDILRLKGSAELKDGELMAQGGDEFKSARELSSAELLEALSKLLIVPSEEKINALNSLSEREVLSKALAGDEYALFNCMYRRLIDKSNIRAASDVILKNPKSTSKTLLLDFIFGSGVINADTDVFLEIFNGNKRAILDSLTTADFESAACTYLALANLGADSASLDELKALTDEMLELSLTDDAMFCVLVSFLSYTYAKPGPANAHARHFFEKLLDRAYKSDGKIEFCDNNVFYTLALNHIAISYGLAEKILELDKADLLNDNMSIFSAYYFYKNRGKFMKNLSSEDIAFIEKRIPIFKAELAQAMKDSRVVDSLCLKYYSGVELGVYPSVPAENFNAFINEILFDFPSLASVPFVELYKRNDGEFKDSFYKKLGENFSEEEILMARLYAKIPLSNRYLISWGKVFKGELKNMDKPEIRKILKEFLESKIESLDFTYNYEVLAYAIYSYKTGSLLEKSDEKALLLAKKLAAEGKPFEISGVYKYLSGAEDYPEKGKKIALPPEDEAVLILAEKVKKSKK